MGRLVEATSSLLISASGMLGEHRALNVDEYKTSQWFRIYVGFAFGNPELQYKKNDDMAGF